MFFRGDNCIKQTWTYHINLESNDLELEGICSTVYLH